MAMKMMGARRFAREAKAAAGRANAPIAWLVTYAVAKSGVEPDACVENAQGYGRVIDPDTMKEHDGRHKRRREPALFRRILRKRHVSAAGENDRLPQLVS